MYTDYMTFHVDVVVEDTFQLFLSVTMDVKRIKNSSNISFSCLKCMFSLYHTVYSEPFNSV